jgi:hypothetical protein
MERVSIGPVMRDDGRWGVTVGGEVGTHLLASPETSMPFSVRAQASMIGGDLAVLVGIATAIDLGPGFYTSHSHGDPMRGVAGRLGGAIGGGHVPDHLSGAARAFLGLGYGVVHPDKHCTNAEATPGCSDMPMLATHGGIELAWSPMFGNGVSNWMISAELYVQHSRIPAFSGHPGAELGITK